MQPPIHFFDPIALPQNPYIWNQLIRESGTLGGYSSEADVNSHVQKVIVDILEALDIRWKVTIRAEVEVMRNRPDCMLILVNGQATGQRRNEASQHSGRGE
jgi:hypothetical protein